MKIDLIYQDSSSNKFWSIEVNKNEHTVTYGRVGTDGTSKTKSFADEEESLKQANKLVASKKKKGYEEVSVKQIIIRDRKTFAGKKIKEFESTFNINTAVKIFTNPYDDDDPIPEQLDKLMQLQGADKIDNLVFGSWSNIQDRGPSKVLDKLIEIKENLKSLKHLFIGDMGYETCEISWINQGNYSDFYQHFPDLESFGVRGGMSLVLGEINLPKLKNLVIESGGLDGKVINDICKSNLPNLEYLELWLGTDEYGGDVTIEQLQPILDGKFPKLKYLGLKNYDTTNQLAVALKGATVIPSLKTLDLSMGTTGDLGAKALFENDELLKLDHLNLRHHFISNKWMEKLKSKFTNQNINLEDQNEVDDDYLYVEIGE